MTAKAGRLISVKVSGDPVAFTDEATTTNDDTVYQITDTALRVWDRAATITVEDGGVAVDPVADPYTVNRLAGKIIFETSDAGRVITVSGDYLPLSTLAEGHSVDFTRMANNGDDSVFGATDVSRQQIARDWSGTIARFFSVDTYLADAFDVGDPVVIEYSPDGGTTPTVRGWALLNKNAFQGDVKSFLEESVSWEGSADADGRSHTSSLTI